MQFAALGAVAFVHEHENLAHRLAGLRFQFLDELLEIIHALSAELVHQRAEQARRGLAELGHQVASAAGAGHGMTGSDENAFDLFVQFVAVGDDHHAGIGLVLQNPLGQQHHDDALAAALGMPDDAALAAVDMRLRRLDAEILVHARQLFHAAIEQHKVVHQLDQPLLVAHLEQVFIQLEAAVVRLVFFPFQEILLFRL